MVEIDVARHQTLRFSRQIIVVSDPRLVFAIEKVRILRNAIRRNIGGQLLTRRYLGAFVARRLLVAAALPEFVFLFQSGLNVLKENGVLLFIVLVANPVLRFLKAVRLIPQE